MVSRDGISRRLLFSTALIFCCLIQDSYKLGRALGSGHKYLIYVEIVIDEEFLPHLSLLMDLKKMARMQHSQIRVYVPCLFAGQSLLKSASSFWVDSWNIRASIAAARRLLAAVIAWISPVRWRLNSSMGITWKSNNSLIQLHLVELEIRLPERSLHQLLHLWCQRWDLVTVVVHRRMHSCEGERRGLEQGPWRWSTFLHPAELEWCLNFSGDNTNLTNLSAFLQRPLHS